MTKQSQSNIIYLSQINIKIGSEKMDYKYIPKLIRAAINNDKKSVEEISLLISRRIKKESPEISAEILKILSCVNSGSDVFRSINLPPVPVDVETRHQLVKVEEPIMIEEPILEKRVFEELKGFVKERGFVERFLEEGILPSNSILLYGKPGVGKTYVAKWLAYMLNMPMITLDLANSISSYLGRSGQNIKSIFEYTKDQNIILFLDEIDAIAKRRDDVSDLGELKRLVNVLLKELDDCPAGCVIIAATNHPELLDKAIWRRFDRNIEVNVPGDTERKLLFERGLGKYKDDINEEILSLIIKGTYEKSAADICKMCDHIKRRRILNPEESITTCVLKEYCEAVVLDTRERKIQICKNIKKSNDRITIKEISSITGISQSSVDRYLKE